MTVKFKNEIKDAKEFDKVPVIKTAKGTKIVGIGPLKMSIDLLKVDRLTNKHQILEGACLVYHLVNWIHERPTISRDRYEQLKPILDDIDISDYDMSLIKKYRASSFYEIRTLAFTIIDRVCKDTVENQKLVIENIIVFCSEDFTEYCKFMNSSVVFCDNLNFFEPENYRGMLSYIREELK